MAQKNNIRSIRFSDKMAELIDRQIGSTFTEKFENLVTRCVWELPQKENELRRIQEQIDRERQRLNDLRKASMQIKQLMRHLDSAQEYIKLVEVQAREIAKSAKKDGT